MLVYQTIHSLLADWKLIVLSLFLHGLFVLEYADLFNQREFFFMFTHSTNMSHQIS